MKIGTPPSHFHHKIRYIEFVDRLPRLFTERVWYLSTMFNHKCRIKI